MTISPSRMQRAGKLLFEHRFDFREVAIEGFGVAALNEELVTVTEDEGSEAVPLRLEEPAGAAGEGVYALGEHGQDRGGEGKVHG